MTSSKKVSLSEVNQSIDTPNNNRLVKHPPRHHVAVKEQMSRILTAQEQEQFSYLLDKLVSGIEQITVE